MWETNPTDHLVMAAIIMLTPRGFARAHQISLMTTTTQWLPYRDHRTRSHLEDAVTRGSQLHAHPAQLSARGGGSCPHGAGRP